ncbi:maleylpyruvate isomerase N-terminal domain-containing protein [Pseudonocardia nigra]|uniref:maleylpyruvate isomerase N-terminal domain-containing protein n=1 Tax=Pseudonocardia nigra TaxID=1921578 RepID=UPI001C5F5C0A|nr:maleylpyruvate isomerase N-terminal domain-containing protein [Pseudonocardia nigra]
MTAWPVSTELAALRIAYSDLATIVASLDEEDSWRPTRCAGWVVRDLLLHLLGDAQRALVALASPAAGPPDRDAVSYWVDSSFNQDPGFGEIRTVRTIASAWTFDNLVRTFVETTRAVVSLAGRATSDSLVTTQGHVLRTDDLLATLAVEAAVHHLDLVVELHRPGPRSEPLALVRRTLEGLLGYQVPEDWSDERWALLGTGRVPPGGGERRALGAAAARIPLLR